MNTVDPQDYARSIELSGADIDSMATGYLEAQLWAGLDYRNEDSEPVHYDENYSLEDISPEYVEHVRAELSEVVAQHPLAVRMYLNARNVRLDWEGSEWSSAFGHDFYLTREHHGAGFWDRGLGELGEYLTRIADSYGSAEMLHDNGEGMLIA
ncbi:hypothetical protein SEA_ERICMILLARD_223 [Mycobacterium phage EricMillard]|uniref:Uncharacterized protein n=1 Tax=Mycobacterium phage Duke13 TaxID=2499038 RepID=A0A3S9UBA5_9CAUD|nr:hypothetical protein SEA_ERICMILLARD_223 [Mycobacterium phage EricMillard]AZS07565.1 hypothetical protein PBI_DUKE13_229 [Mycobacterium phage Duke13]QBI97668.1 hypothetical protein SEA_HUGHESYANG_227 [Mycobacterium phage Hughesyang]